MKAFISLKFAKGEHGPWAAASNVPNKVLLETNLGHPAIKVDGYMFYLGQPSEGVTEYRVLPKGTIVVCIQE